jgi:uncharacterized peroxidase-related enzyme
VSDPGSWFPIPDEAELPSELRGLFGKARERLEREMIAVVVSAANRCLYCLVAHGAELHEQLGDPVLGERVSYDWRRAGLDQRRTAICAFAEKLTLQPQEVTRAEHLGPTGTTRPT